MNEEAPCLLKITPMDTEELFDKNLDDLLENSDKLKCKLPGLKSEHDKPVFSMSFSKYKEKEAPRIIIKKKKKHKVKELW